MNLELREGSLYRWLYHIAFWVTYTILWSVRDVAFYPDFGRNVIQNTLTFSTLTPLIYTNLYVLIPRFLLKKKYFEYTILLLLTFCICIYITIVIQTVFISEYFATLTGAVILLGDAFELCLISSLFKLLKSWYQKEKYSRELESKSYEAEVNYLKAQINPHFLFNTLNNIYFSIPKKPEIARDIVLQLSDMLSHQLYDARQPKVSLQKELDYLIKYIELEKIRQGDIVKVNDDFETLEKDWQISPLLLLPFVENAFKHGNKTNPNGYWIYIHASVDEAKFLFKVENSFDAQEREKSKTSGIGLENVKRRLELIYPKKHHLSIQQKIKNLTITHEEVHQEQIFEVHLEIDLG